MIEKAIEKIEEELEAFEGDRKSEVVSEAVAEKLKGFCEESAELAEAIANSEKTLSECCKYVVEGCGDYLSDIEAYKRAVEFYVPDAEIEFNMKVVMPTAASGAGATLNLSLESFM